MSQENTNEPLCKTAVVRSCLNCKYAVKLNKNSNAGKCGNPITETYKRNENNRTLFGSICDSHNYA